MTLDSIKAEVDALSVEERKLLIHYLVETLEVSPEKPSDLHKLDDALLFFKLSSRALRSEALHDPLEFEGAGAYARDDSIDAQEYVNQLRSEWDDRP